MQSKLQATQQSPARTTSHLEGGRQFAGHLIDCIFRSHTKPPDLAATTDVCLIACAHVLRAPRSHVSNQRICGHRGQDVQPAGQAGGAAAAGRQEALWERA